MKRIISLLCLVLVFSLALSPLCHAEENVDTLADWRIQITVPENAEAVLEGQEYYLYAGKTGSIPYVMLSVCHYSSEDAFIDDFTAFMQDNYADLEATGEPEGKLIGGKRCTEFAYRYTVGGNAVKDRRIVITVGELTYLFCSKEIEARGMTVGTMLEDVVASCRFLDEDGNPLAEGGAFSLKNAYLYTLENGMPKYWLDFTGMMSHNPVLHCYFRSGDPTFYEVCYILDLETADIDEDLIVFRKFFDQQGCEITGYFQDLCISPSGQDLVMEVVRDERTLAGGGEDNLLSGRYTMSPAGVHADFKYCQDDGMLKYWLDMDGDDMLLHAMFRSGSAGYEEQVFLIDQQTAEANGEYSAVIKNVYTDDGEDVSNWFESFTLSYVEGAVILNIKRDESTLAGGTEDSFLTGVYLLEPYTRLCPAKPGPYSPDELAKWAQISYFVDNGFYPPEAEVAENQDGSFTIHLYEVVELDGVKHTATSAWYTVDEYGAGCDDITEKPIKLCG